MTKPLQGSGRFSPLQGSGRFSPLQGSGRFSPLQGSGRFSPLQGSGRFSPLQGSGRSKPLQGSGRSKPLQGSAKPAPLLRIRNLESCYGPITALRGVSLDVPEGRIVAVLGANGAGKTTLLKTVSGVLEPEKGSIDLSGESIEGVEPERIVRLGVVHVPEGREVFPLLSVAENLAMGAYTRSDDGTDDDLEMVFGYFPILKERLRQSAGTLSGGQQQMLAIARGLMARPRVLLLDEPSLGLAPIVVGDIFAVIRRLNQERGVTMLLVEQNARAALDVADHGYVMEVGRVVMDGPSERLRNSRDIQEFYLGAQERTQRGERRWKRRKTWR